MADGAEAEGVPAVDARPSGEAAICQWKPREPAAAGAVLIEMSWHVAGAAAAAGANAVFGGSAVGRNAPGNGALRAPVKAGAVHPTGGPAWPPPLLSKPWVAAVATTPRGAVDPSPAGASGRKERMPCQAAGSGEGRSLHQSRRAPAAAAAALVCHATEAAPACRKRAARQREGRSKHSPSGRRERRRPCVNTSANARWGEGGVGDSG